jgi:aspartyl-tRNA synthetase
MANYTRTHTCGALRTADIGNTITLSGWVHRNRDHGGLIFVDLRDRFGLTQLVFDPDKDAALHAQAEKLRSEWVITITGEVRARAEGMANNKLATGDVEVIVSSMQVLSAAKTPPFSICDEFIETNEELRLRYRYLDMRRGKLTDNLITRHKAMQATRAFLDGEQFIEVQTPILGKATPEGARDYLVPSRIYRDSFYALPQSPQLLKQLLMVSGLDRYYQIAPCFRDEDLRADRQPEFSQIDMEISFGTPKQLFPIVEGMMKSIWKRCLNVDIEAPFLQMSHPECIERYGTDKPDLRFDMQLHTVSDIAERSDFTVFKEQIAGGGIVKGICVKGGADISRKGIDTYTSFVGRFGIKGLAWMKFQSGAFASSIV